LPAMTAMTSWAEGREPRHAPWPLPAAVVETPADGEEIAGGLQPLERPVDRGDGRIQVREILPGPEAARPRREHSGAHQVSNAGG
jgi:hypothetical protein